MTFTGRFRASLAVLLLALVPGAPLAAAPVETTDTAFVRTERTEARLLAYAPDGLKTGAQAWLALELKHAPGWHSYWTNPGDAGLPTQLTWTLPPGLAAGDVQWPAPERIDVGALVNYGYEGSVLLRVPLAIASGTTGERQPVRLHADWLVCKTECIPESGDFILALPQIGPVGVTQAGAFEASAAALPEPLKIANATATASGGTLTLTLPELPAELAGGELEVFMEVPGLVEAGAPRQESRQGNQWTARLPLAPQRTASPERLAVVLKAAGHARRIDLPVAGTWPAPFQRPPQEAVWRANSQVLAQPQVVAGDGNWRWLLVPGLLASMAFLLVVAGAALALRRRTFGPAIASLALLIGSSAVAFGVASGALDPDGDPMTVSWDAWAPGRVDQLLADGRSVWLRLEPQHCLRCDLQSRHLVADETLRADVRQRNVATLLVPSDTRDPAIAELLRQLGQPNLPAQVFYSPGQAPLVMTGQPSRHGVTAAVRRSVQANGPPRDNALGAPAASTGRIVSRN